MQHRTRHQHFGCWDSEVRYNVQSHLIHAEVLVHLVELWVVTCFFFPLLIQL